ncbi:glyoxal oxidase [Kwoniella mangroviensis CBS 10435]|uniref:Glyoxal oxidase n=1 Tax=Kwoniella mangroviensis CBS 10435 TaxID=1331196 RepID=A0A1B9IPD7_9TREE|nr:glyoxal oxidase [Kwoniella mangroviensis CBS 8507]OCF57439.1 glyoxal oxidase [Kwoniella mangroviensis CBS 10435]OCF70231.1 glyoxal oxidase [Kwoniella mangroviensis CBS 8507]
MSSINLFTLLSLLPLLVLGSAWRDPAAPPLDGRKRAAAAATPLDFESVGDTGVSAQMVFLGNNKKIYVLDKTENNPVEINGEYGTHPAWATEYDIETNEYRTMDVFSNTFCAGGGVLGNGTWVVFGGNQPVTTGGVASTAAEAYSDTDGGTAIRMLNPCTDESCEYIQGTTSYSVSDDNTGGWLQMTGRRWYPMVEALPDGSLIIIGGDKNGGYVNTQAQDNPTYEFFPPRADDPVDLQFLADTLPINLYALTWLMPSGKLFMQANRKTILYDYNTKETTNLPDMPYAARVYPASAATAMLPLIPDNDYAATILFCGGSNTTQWGNDGTAGYNVTAVPADNTCVRITPEGSAKYEDDDYMFEGRSMGQFVILPDGTFWMGNGVGMGTAGYGDDGYSVGQSYGQAPIYMPAIYNSSAPSGSRWNRTGLTASANERMYHSTAILLPDGSIFIAGSNPNKDFTTTQWRSRTDSEKWYPWYYNEERPVYEGLPQNLTYGGSSFNITLNSTDEATAQNTKIVVIRGGFNTHAIGFGQRYLQLNSSYSVDMNTGKTTHIVSQMPGTNGPNLFQPGPAMFFVVVNGVPSQGEFIMVGSGKLETQTTQANEDLPTSTIIALTTPSSTESADSSSASTNQGATTTSSSTHAVVIGLTSTLIAGLISCLSFL